MAGPPNWFYVVMIPVELIVPVVNYALIRHVTPLRGNDTTQVRADA